MSTPVEINPLEMGGGGYQISRSVRFRSSASAYFTRTPVSTTNQKTWTFSCWVKRGLIATQYQLISAGGTSNDLTYIGFNSSDQIDILNNIAGATVFRKTTTAVYRDPSAWYHIVVIVDTTNATAGNRVLLYVNGIQVTAFSTSTDPTLNQNTQIDSTSVHTIGRTSSVSTAYLDGYLAEVNFIDGQALTPSSFGYTDNNGIWQPKAYTGTYGTNGFYLKFTDNSAATATTIGKDYSGNGNNWTPNNISVTAGTTYDSMVDSPTVGAAASNYAVLNPLSNIATDATLSNGNLAVAYGTSATIASAVSTMSMTTGKWYMEMQITATSATNPTGVFGIQNQAMPVANYPGFTSTSYGLSLPNGNKVNNSSSTAYGSAFVINDIAMMAVDMVAGKVWWGKNGTWFNSGNPATNTNEAFSGLPSEMWVSVGDGSTASTSTMAFNFGQRPFSYTPPAGFKALNTYNLPAATINNGATVMAASTYTGNGATNSIVNSGNNTAAISFKPDLVWIKNRSAANSHNFADSIRGPTAGLASNSTTAEYTQNGFASFNSNGFGLAADTSQQVNNNAATYIGWQWQAGQGVTSSNTSGSITSTVSVNQSGN